MNKKSGVISLFGCDRDDSYKKINELNGFRFKKTDFMVWPPSMRFDTIVMNPPYVRHHFINNEDLKVYRELLKDTCVLSKRSDLWAYFLIKSITHLKEGGSVGAILPWSFLQSDYAVNVRKWVLDQFKQIKMLALNNEYFEKAEERIIYFGLKITVRKQIPFKYHLQIILMMNINLPN